MPHICHLYSPQNPDPAEQPPEPEPFTLWDVVAWLFTSDQDEPAAEPAQDGWVLPNCLRPVGPER